MKSVRAGRVEEEPPRKGPGQEMGRGMQPLPQNKKTEEEIPTLLFLLALSSPPGATHQIPKGKGSWRCNL